MSLEWLGPESKKCPDLCCDLKDTNCLQMMGAHGHTVNANE